MKKASTNAAPLFFGGAFMEKGRQRDIPGNTGYYISSLDGTQLYVEESGKGSPVIFLSGGPGLNPVYLQPVWEHFAENHRCIVLHQRGTGKSFVPVVDVVSMSMDNYINDLEALRQHLHLKQLVLAGHSWGAMLAMLYLSRKQEHVEKLVLIDPGGLTSSCVAVFIANMQKKLDKEDLAELKKAESLHMPNMKAIWPGYFFHRERALATRSLIGEIVGQEGVTDISFANYFAVCDTMIEALREITATPIILIKGKEDPMGESTSTEIKNVLTQTVIHQIDECGHLPWMENPQQVTEFFSLLGDALK